MTQRGRGEFVLTGQRTEISQGGDIANAGEHDRRPEQCEESVGR